MFFEAAVLAMVFSFQEAASEMKPPVPGIDFHRAAKAWSVIGSGTCHVSQQGSFFASGRTLRNYMLVGL